MQGTIDIINNSYKNHTRKLIVKTLKPKLIFLLVVLTYFIFSDLHFRNNINAFYTRIIPLTLTVFLLIFSAFSKNREHFITNTYLVLLASLLMMMYAKCFVHIDDGLASCVSGTILVIFTISLEIKTNSKYAALVYAVPTFLFLFITITFFDLDKEQWITLSNIFPILIIGYIINRTQEKLRYQSFEKSCLFEKEKERAEELYNKTLIQNSELIKQKHKIENTAKYLEEHKTKLQKINTTKDRFFSIIAHDLRNPFTAILNGSKLLADRTESYNQNQVIELSQLINKSANQGFNLLNNLLHWSMVQTDEIKFIPVAIRLNDIIIDTIEFYSTNLDNKKIFIRNEISDTFTLVADKFMLETTLRNLIANAIKYTPACGCITLNANKTKEQCLISVLDTGVGIESKHVGNLFKVDKHISTTGTANEIGTGLGLVICKEFIEKHNGTISVISKPNNGSCFSITLPQ